MPDPRNLIGPLFDALSSSLRTLTCEEYARPIEIMHGATIGQHVRHILDIYLCLMRGLPSGVVNYEQRQRDPLIETDPSHAISMMDALKADLPEHDRHVVVEGCYDTDTGTMIHTDSSYHRELLYNFEHTVHHMALIRIGLEVSGHTALPEAFGVAPSTLKFRKACAQ